MTHAAKALANGLEPVAHTGSNVGVTDSADREIDLGLGKALGVSDRQILRSSIRVMHQAL
jgi:hypothetical protein